MLEVEGRSGGGGGCGALRGLMGALLSRQRSLCTEEAAALPYHLSFRISPLKWDWSNASGIVADRDGGAASCTD